MATRPIHPDVRRIARRWAGSSPAFPKLIHAVIQAEGGTLDHLLKAVRCSIPSCKDTDEAIEITCRSAAHHLCDFIAQGNPAGFVSYWAAKWAPVGVANDPTSLNKNWPKNTLAAWKPQV
jgi:hypothetical protein